MSRIGRELLCGLTYLDIVSCSGMSQKAAAKKLGVNAAYFNRVVRRLSLSHWFVKPKQIFTTCISKEDIIRLAAEGYTQHDAAFIAGVDERWFKRLVARWQLNALFPNSGKAAHISKVGYI